MKPHTAIDTKTEVTYEQRNLTSTRRQALL